MSYRTAARLSTVALVLALCVLAWPVTASIERDARSLFEARPAAGKYLVASESMRDPRFRHSVILLINHDDKGSLGVIINRPSELPLSEVLEDGGDAPLYIGGPVQPRVFSMLFRSDADLGFDDNEEGPEVMRVSGDVDFIIGFQAVTEAWPRLDADDPRRVFAGYAGWSAGQLDGELKQGGWHLVSDTADLVFSDQPGQLWSRLMERLRGHWI